MKKLDPILLDILTKYDEKSEDALWDCHGVWVAYHRAIERIAAKAGVVFDLPQIIEANSANKIVSICVQGRMGDRSEWSFGEASPANNKNAYPYAMAEKRAKDRVVLKLIGLHGLVYSEEEMSEEEQSKKEPTKSSAQLKREGSWENVTADLSKDLQDVKTLVALESVKASYRERVAREGWNKTYTAQLKDIFLDKEEEISRAMEIEE